MLKALLPRPAIRPGHVQHLPGAAVLMTGGEDALSPAGKRRAVPPAPPAGDSFSFKGEPGLPPCPASPDCFREQGGAVRLAGGVGEQGLSQRHSSGPCRHPPLLLLRPWVRPPVLSACCPPCAGRPWVPRVVEASSDVQAGMLGSGPVWGSCRLALLLGVLVSSYLFIVHHRLPQPFAEELVKPAWVGLWFWVLEESQASGPAQ